MSSSLDNYPNAYDLQASEPIREILEKYFTNIVWAYEFQESDLSNKKAMLLDIALEIDRALNPKKVKPEQNITFACQHGRLVGQPCPHCSGTNNLHIEK